MNESTQANARSQEKLWKKAAGAELGIETGAIINWIWISFDSILAFPIQWEEDFLINAEEF